MKDEGRLQRKKTNVTVEKGQVRWYEYCLRLIQGKSGEWGIGSETDDKDGGWRREDSG